MTLLSTKRSVFAVVSSLFLAVTPVAASAESLSDAMISAYRHSGLLDQTRALLRAADEDVAQAVATLRPIIGWSANITQSEPNAGENLNGSLALTADLLLYDFGASDLAIEAAKGIVLATRENLVNVEQQVLLRAVQAFMSVRRAIAFVDLAQNNERVITTELRAARDRFEVGEVTRTDVSIAESRLAAAKASVAAQIGVLSQAREEYKAATGHFPGSLSAPPRIARSKPSLMRSTRSFCSLISRRTVGMRRRKRAITGPASIRPIGTGTETRSVPPNASEFSASRAACVVASIERL